MTGKWPPSTFRRFKPNTNKLKSLVWDEVFDVDPEEVTYYNKQVPTTGSNQGYNRGDFRHAT